MHIKRPFLFFWTKDIPLAYTQLNIDIKNGRPIKLHQCEFILSMRLSTLKKCDKFKIQVI